MRKNRPNWQLALLLLPLLFGSCAGTVKTVGYANKNVPNYKNAYIISAEYSQYIEFPGILYNGVSYIVLPDGPAKEHKKIGNTDIVIKKELEKYGIHAEIGKKGDALEGFDLIVEYYDTWRDDLKKVLDKLEIVFISPTGELIAKSTYNMKELHNYPTPEKEVANMIKELLEAKPE
ncbi:MAG: hypothetical protein LBO74_10590 [Candidatus Symbiothrix sp.]|jgi:hypothetical protein|nr:hypothetical protein [Candidatus Symbiothrix sp.]